MSPPLEVFPASELPFRVQATAQGKRRKQAIDLARCEPLELVQYACWLEGEERSRDARVICDPLVRLFRRCAQGVMVETTGWEKEGKGMMKD